LLRFMMQFLNERGVHRAWLFCFFKCCRRGHAAPSLIPRVWDAGNRSFVGNAHTPSVMKGILIGNWKRLLCILVVFKVSNGLFSSAKVQPAGC
jgi:hypothetical protein